MADDKPQSQDPLAGTFKGRWQTRLAAGNRLMVPGAYHDLLRYGGVVAASNGPDNHLLLFGAQHWQRMMDTLQQQTGLSAGQIAAQLYGKMLKFNALGSDGSISLTQELVDHAGLHDQIVFIGVIYYAEVWDRKSYIDARMTKQELDDLAAALA